MKKLLVISAHGADWCTRAGGAIIKAVKSGWNVTVFSLTYGEHGESGAFWKNNPGTNLDCVKQCRKKEAQLAAGLIGVNSIQFFDYGDYPLIMDETRIRRLTADILSLRPDVILTHWLKDPINMDHEITAKAVIRSVFASGMRGALPDTEPHFIPDIFLFETTMPHSEFNHFEINIYLDIEDVLKEKMAAISCFAAQPQLVEYYDRCSKNRGIQANDWSRGRRKILAAEAYNHYTPYLGMQLPFSQL